MTMVGGERVRDRAAMDHATGAWLDLHFRKARSFNGYQDRPVAQVQLREIWELAKMGPTSANQSPARIVWCLCAEARARLATHASKTNAKKIISAPVAAIIAMDLDFPEMLPRLFPHVDARPWFAGNDALVESSAFRNSSLQGAYLLLAARAWPRRRANAGVR